MLTPLIYSIFIFLNQIFYYIIYEIIDINFYSLELGSCIFLVPKSQYRDFGTENIQINLTSPESIHSILVGLILGDAGLYKSSPTSNTRLEMSFGSNYKDFAEFIQKLLSLFISNPVTLA